MKISVILYIDFGVDHLCEMTQKTKFPWLLSNIIDNLTNKPLADGQESCIIEWNGYKVSCKLHTHQ
jgi:5'-nucleotidase